MKNIGSVAAILALFTLYFILQFVGYGYFSTNLQFTHGNALAFYFLIGIVILLPPFLATRLRDSVPLRPKWWSILIATEAIAIFHFHGLIFNRLFKFICNNSSNLPIGTAPIWTESFGTIVSFCLLGPIFEELFFRGLLFGVAKKIGGSSTITVLLSSLLFGLMHFSIVDMCESSARLITAFLFGVFLGYLYHETRNILWPILLHMLWNIYVFTS